MNLPFYIARRYLFAKKSHNVINIISAISAIGMAIGTAALIIILSVFNGFESLIKDSMGNVEPEICVTPAKGKVFVPDMEGLEWASEQEKVASICNVLQESVYIGYDAHNGLAKAKGVDKIYEEVSPIRDHMTDGQFKLHHGDIPMAVVGAGLAYSMSISHRFLSPIEIYFPSRTKRISLANPVAAIEEISVFPSGTFAINGDPDKNLIILPIEKMRELLDYEEEVSAVEIRLTPDCCLKESKRIIKGLAEKLGPEYKVSDRFQQNPSLYKMMKYEKASVYVILLFVIIIIGFNIFGSLAMLIIEKRDDIGTLKSLGADDKLVRKIFVLEGWLISIIGMLAGLVIGLGFCFLQTHFGFIKMPASFMYEAYPMIVQPLDIFICCASIVAVGYLIALLPTLTYLKKN